VGWRWGEKGYGYLPYDFVLEGLAEDWWTLIEQGRVDTGQFGEWLNDIIIAYPACPNGMEFRKNSIYVRHVQIILTRSFLWLESLSS
jgi:hypothetical protein